MDVIKDSFIGLLLDFIKNSFFDNWSTLPSLFPLITEKSLSDVDFSVEDIKNIIRKLDSNKAYGDDMISIRCLNYVINPFLKLLVFSSNLA